ncbi:hypothetical protein IFM89_025147 [Coptis chinensis]|uniref:Transketolase C-terminal domain-containing protein n=1 Tax=Coptis chinensis TaxID=261450 RepID=A0A835HXZ5_9MAGN|nr:hypothetical protein IFM89_025147 [Coptis chinensis]
MTFLLCKRDKELVVVHAGMEMDPSLQLFHASFPDRFFDVGMAEQHAMTFATADEVELVNMVVTAAHVDDRPICFRYPRGVVGGMNSFLCNGIPLEIGKGRVLVEGKDVALLGYGVMVQNCLRARSLLASLGIHVIVADARFCKPLDIKIVRELCKEHTFLITVEERSMGGFASHIAQFIALDGQLDGKIKILPRLLLVSSNFLGAFEWRASHYQFPEVSFPSPHYAQAFPPLLYQGHGPLILVFLFE